MFVSVCVLHKTSHQEISPRSCTVTARKCIKSVMNVQSSCLGHLTSRFLDILFAAVPLLLNSLKKLPVKALKFSKIENYI